MDTNTESNFHVDVKKKKEQTKNIVKEKKNGQARDNTTVLVGRSVERESIANIVLQRHRLRIKTGRHTVYEHALSAVIERQLYRRIDYKNITQ